jgi:hypothetical protein
MKPFLSLVVYFDGVGMHHNILPIHNVDGSLCPDDEIWKMLMFRVHPTVRLDCTVSDLKKLALNLFEKLDIAVNIQLKKYYRINENLNVIEMDYKEVNDNE